jgi:pentatricopeptide repeat protein
MKVCSAAGQEDKISEVFVLMEADGILPNTISYNTALTVYKTGYKWQKAVELLKEMDERGLADGVSYLTVMHICVKGRNSKVALDLFESLRTRQNIKPDVKMYSIAITACGKLAGYWPRMLEIWDELCSNRFVQQDRGAYAAVIQASGGSRAGKIQLVKAESCYLEMIRNKFTPNKETLLTMEDVYQRLGSKHVELANVRERLQLFQGSDSFRRNFSQQR